jgi:CMP-N,N'-diacetyllegionaminic acid synthase
MKNKLGVITARGGSKGLPGKNLKDLGGKPLLAWSILEAKKSTKLDRLILSTEDEEIANVGREYNIDVPFKRPKELAGDTTHTPDILINALEEMEKIDGIKYDLIILLQPTVPFRKSEHIDNAIEKFESSSFDSLITIQKQDYPPWWMFKLDNGQLSTAFKYGDDINVFNLERQQFPNVYKPNGSVYVTWTELLRKNHQLVNPYNCGYLVIEDEFQVNIDTALDFMIAEAVAQKIG